MFFRSLDFLQCIPALLREKIFLIDQLNAIFPCERFGTFSIHHYVSGFLHDEPGETDGIFDVLQRGDSTDTERFAVHNGCVHLVRADACKH